MRPSRPEIGLALILLGAVASPGRPAAKLWSVEIEGRVRAVQTACDDPPPCSLFVLAERESSDESADDGVAEWTLERWDSASPSTLTRVLGPFAARLRPTLEVLDQGNGPHLALVADRRLWLLATNQLAKGGLRALGPPTYEESNAAIRILLPDPTSPRVLALGIGELEIIALSDPDSSSRFRLPVEVERRPTGLRLETPPVRPLGTKGLFVAGPKSHGDLRLRTLLIDSRQPPHEAESEAGSEAGVPNPVDMWSLLPAPEKVVEARYEWLDGKPILITVTLRADKVGILEKKKLRVFELGADRTRSGRPPFFEILTSSRMWQELDLHTTDVDGDGLVDMVLLQPEGLGGNRLIVDFYRGLEGARFDTKRYRSVLPEVGENHPWHYGTDWNGDEVADLLVLSGSRVELYPGLQEPKRRAVLEASPRTLLQISESDPQLRRLTVRGDFLVSYARAPGEPLLIVRLDN